MSFVVNFFKNIIHNMLQLLSFGKKTITNSLSIYVKSNTGNTLSVDLNPKWDIKDVKEYVAPLINMEPSEIKIIFAGKELSDSTKLEVSAPGMRDRTVSILATPLTGMWSRPAEHIACSKSSPHLVQEGEFECRQFRSRRISRRAWAIQTAVTNHDRLTIGNTRTRTNHGKRYSLTVSSLQGDFSKY